MTKEHFTSSKHMADDSRVAVYNPRGALNGHADCFNWLEEVRRDIQGGNARIVLNLSEVTHIDSTGLGILASVHVSATKAGGKLLLTGLNDRQRLLFKTTWLFKVMETADDEAQAVRACVSPA